MITLWTASEEKPRTAELPIRIRPRGTISRVAYEDDTHIWVVKWEKGTVTVFRRSKGAERGGNALVLGDLERAREVLRSLQDALKRIEETTAFGYHGGLEVSA